MRGWCQISVSQKRIWSKKGFFGKNGHLFFGGFWLHFIVAAWLSLDALEGCAKNPIKIGFFWHTLLLDAEETEKRTKKKAQKKGYTPKMGGLQNGQEVVPLFFQKTGFSKSSKTPIFIAFPEKMGGHHFFSKRLCFKKDTFRRAKKW